MGSLLAAGAGMQFAVLPRPRRDAMQRLRTPTQPRLRARGALSRPFHTSCAFLGAITHLLTTPNLKKIKNIVDVVRRCYTPRYANLVRYYRSGVGVPPPSRLLCLRYRSEIIYPGRNLELRQSGR